MIAKPLLVNLLLTAYVRPPTYFATEPKSQPSFQPD